MSGEEIKKILKAEGIGLCNLAKRMGYAREQNLYSVLGVNDVRSGVIESIAKTIGKPISWFYGEAEAPALSASPENTVPVSGDNISIATLSERFLSLLEEKDRQINTLLNLLAQA